MRCWRSCSRWGRQRVHCLLPIKDGNASIMYNHCRIVHQQRPYFWSETSGCSGRRWRLWRNLVWSDREFHTIRRPGDGSRCIRTCCTLWWHIRIIRTTRVLHSSQGLWLGWSGLHNAWRSKTSLGAPGSAGDMSGGTSNHSHVFCLYSHVCIDVSI